MPGPFGEYAAEAVNRGAASDAPIKRSTYGASIAAGIVAVFMSFNAPFELVFGEDASPWLKFATLAVVLVVWGAILVVDTSKRPAPGATATRTPGEPLKTETEVKETLDLAAIEHQIEVVSGQLTELQGRLMQLEGRLYSRT